jgi:hypothetical protein
MGIVAALGTAREAAVNRVEYQASFWFPVTPAQLWAVIERFDLFESWRPWLADFRRWPRAGGSQRAARNGHPAGAVPAAARRPAAAV